MRKPIIVLFVVLSMFLVSCFGPNPPDDLSIYQGIPTAHIDQNCLGEMNDVCALFDCMVDLCWCDDSSPDLPILYESEGISVANEDEAIAVVNTYLNEEIQKGREVGYLYGKMYMIKAKRAVKLNNVFFNVFAEDDHGDEFTYTVVADGTILKTICGV